MKPTLFLGCLIYCLALHAGADVIQGTMESEHGCTLAYERFITLEPRTDDVQVLLAHGFKRKLKHMRGWAEYWQAQGIDTTIMSFCNSSWFNGHHQRNADDLIALATELGIEAPVYAGYSAGGLAAYLAAYSDKRARGFLGLDAVDSGDLAMATVGALSAPALFISAAPSMCNARGNFSDIVSRYSVEQSIHLPQATHCDFEWPFDKRCSLVCGRGDKDKRAETHETIRRTATEWVLELPDNSGQVGESEEE